MDGEGGRKIGSFLDFHSCLHETPCNTFPRSPRRNNFMQNKLSSFPRFLFPFSRIDSGNAWEKRKVSRRWISDRFGYADRLSRCIASQLQIRMTNDRCLVEPTGLSIFPSQKFIESPPPLFQSILLLLLLLEDRFTRFPRVLENAVMFKGEGDCTRLFGAAVFHRETRHA